MSLFSGKAGFVTGAAGGSGGASGTPFGVVGAGAAVAVFGKPAGGWGSRAGRDGRGGAGACLPGGVSRAALVVEVVVKVVVTSCRLPFVLLHAGWLSRGWLSWRRVCGGVLGVGVRGGRLWRVALHEIRHPAHEGERWRRDRHAASGGGGGGGGRAAAPAPPRPDDTCIELLRIAHGGGRAARGAVGPGGPSGAHAPPGLTQRSASPTRSLPGAGRPPGASGDREGRPRPPNPALPPLTPALGRPPPGARAACQRRGGAARAARAARGAAPLPAPAARGPTPSGRAGGRVRKPGRQPCVVRSFWGRPAT